MQPAHLVPAGGVAMRVLAVVCRVGVVRGMMGTVMDGAVVPGAGECRGCSCHSEGEHRQNSRQAVSKATHRRGSIL